MRVYNGTKSQLDLPLSGIQRITIPAHTVSGDIMPSNEFLSLLVGSYDYSEIALIVSGPYEISMCAGVSGSTGFVVQSLEEAIERFAPKEEKKVEEIVEPEVEKEAEVICECKNETPVESVEDEVEELPVEEPVIVSVPQDKDKKVQAKGKTKKPGNK